MSRTSGLYGDSNRLSSSCFYVACIAIGYNVHAEDRIQSGFCCVDAGWSPRCLHGVRARDSDETPTHLTVACLAGVLEGLAGNIIGQLW